MYVSSFHFASPCFVTSIFQIFWFVSSCSKVFPIYLIRFICYETEMGLYFKKDVCYIVSFCFIYETKRGLFICYKNRNGFIKKSVCYIVSFRFTLFHNEHISIFLVCFILFQSFFYISYSFHLLRNRNGFIFQKKKNMYISSFHFISPCFVTSIFQIFCSVSSCFRVFPIYLIPFIHYETEMGLYKKDVCFIV